ncbi:MAG TPA: TIGR01459 family HAD-type hydrolase [Aliidongia sp.]|uniref:TIGR01459 family HAD-type hydrolase n=1 Tax=Aliidongia sp. TaxID=1914230 RepID=UPI002DDD2509|nr:TIGR01459 family HAD-type hydrolase [Aliidongia sp.]HEV2677688.1 TIGR01459 family HAD-type hydrolase [Aliidongia sp.]
MRLLHGLAQILDRFDACLVDQYGVLHDGTAIFPAAADSLFAVTAAGKPVVVITNSGKRAAENIARLQRLGLPRDAFADLVSSGELTWQLLRDRPDAFFQALGHRCLLVARPGEAKFFDGLAIEIVDRIERASFILLSSIDQVGDQSAFDDLLRDAVRRRVPMLCSNPDLLSVVPGGAPVPGPGSAARRYEEYGGLVRIIGKPYPDLFDAAQRKTGIPDRSRILVIGDSLHHDIAGGRDGGFTTLLVASGVHAPDLMPGGVQVDPSTLAELCDREGIIPDHVIKTLAF